jgi:hypothetical protein
MKPTLPALILALAVLTACGGAPDDSTSDAATRSEPDPPVQAYDQALDRARGVNQDVQDAAQRQRDQIEEQEGGN